MERVLEAGDYIAMFGGSSNDLTRIGFTLAN
jgi:hypothetical protein